MRDDKVTPIHDSPGLYAIHLTKEGAVMLHEMCVKTAAPGEKAHILADLFAQADAAKKWAGGA